MELKPVYRIEWARDDERRRHSFRSSKCSWSTTNLIAFTSETSADSSDNTHRSRKETKVYIHIVDPNRPWDIHSFDTGHSDTITDIKWHDSAKYILSVDRDCVFKLWSMKNNVINDWQCDRTVSIKERTVCFSWLRTPNKFLFSDMPKDYNHLVVPGNTQQFSRCKTKHPLSKLSATSQDGWITVTETGKVYFICMNADVAMTMVQIDTNLQGITAADITFANDIDVDNGVDHAHKQSPNGYVIIGLADGLVGSAAKFYKISFHYTSRTYVTMKCSSLQTLFPECNKLSHPFSISHLKFLHKNSGANVVIFNKGLQKSYVERWRLTDEYQQLHELCQQQMPHKKPSPIKVWERVSVRNVRNHISSMAISWLPLDPDKNQNFTYPSTSLILAFNDGYIQVINSLSLATEMEFQNIQYSLEKSNIFNALHYSPCACCVVGITGDGTMYLYRCQPAKAISQVQVSIAVVHLLQYCLLSGFDWWDVLISLKHQGEEILEATLKLFEQECRNVSLGQLNSKNLSIKAAILGLTSASETQIRDCYSKQYLLAVANFFKSLVPTGYEKLTTLCQQVAEVDVETIRQSLDMREFQVEPSMLKIIHPLSQWLADRCVSLIGIFVVKQGRENMPGASLFQDMQAILLFKQLVLLILIWSKSYPGVLPNCAVQIEKLDCVLHLFKIVSQLWMVNKQAIERTELEAAALELEPFFLNHLNFVYQTSMMSPSNQGVIGRHSYVKADEPEDYEYGFQPRDRMLSFKLLTGQYNGNIDVISQLFLGNISEERLRHCIKCEGVSLLAKPSAQTENIWEAKWMRSCICGGLWRQTQNAGT